MSKAQAAVLKRDLDDYSKATSEDVSHLMVQSQMRVSIWLGFFLLLRLPCLQCHLSILNFSQALNEAKVVSQRCLTWEQSLMSMKARLAESKSCKKNLHRVVELEKLRAELVARDGDVKVAVEAKDKVVVDLQHLIGQIEGAKVAAVSQYRAFEAFDDNNTRYFLSGFETFCKKAGEHFPDLDFSVSQPYNDNDSIVEGVDEAQFDDQVDDAFSK